MSKFEALPEGWLAVPLGEIADVQLGKMLDKKRTDGVPLPYLRNVNVRWGRIEVNDLLEMPFKDHELDRFAVRSGDVMVCEGGEPGRAAVWAGESEGIKYQKALHRVRLGGGLPPNWLVYQLLLDASTGQLAKQFTGTTIGHLPREAFIEYATRLAPLSEQNRIIAAIESYFTRLDDAVATLERVQRNLKRYRASVLKAAVEGRLVPTEAELARAEGRDYDPASVLLARILKERRRRWEEAGCRGKYKEPAAPDTSDLPELPEGWCWATVEHVGAVQLGQQRSPSKAAAAVHFPCIRAANITWEGLSISDVKTMGFVHPERYLLRPGDVLLAEASGSPMEAGKPVVWHGEVAGACFQNTVIRVRLTQADQVLPDFMRCVFLSMCWSGDFARLAPGVGIVHIGAERLASTPIPIAPLPEQQRIVAALDRIFIHTRVHQVNVSRAIRRCQRLRQSILKWAFEGKLAVQDPSDEPASLLLERIRAEREGTDGAFRGKPASSGRRRR